MLYELKDLYDGAKISCRFCEGRGFNLAVPPAREEEDIPATHLTQVDCDICDGKGVRKIRLEKIGEQPKREAQS